jgi:hypothetical protein
VGLVAVDARREAHAAAVHGKLLGRPFADYQRGLSERLAEPAPGGRGYAHTTARILAPRQVGKTATLLAVQLGRMALYAGYSAAYTAQTGIVVTHVFANPETGWLSDVGNHPILGKRWRPMRSQGREMLVHRDGGGYLKAFAPVAGRLRSNALDCVIMDECQEHTESAGQTLMADIGPVFTTRPMRQHILVGTAGGPGWWRDQVERGRAGNGLLIEIGTWPDGADPENPAVWREHHPGLRAGLTDESHLRAQLAELGPELFAREYGNRFSGSASLDTPLRAEAWEAAQYRGEQPPRPQALAFDTAGDGSAACIVAASQHDGRTVAGVADHRPGTGWLVDRIAELHTTYPRAIVQADARGPAGAAVDALERRGVPVSALPADERPTAHGHLVTELDAGRLALLHHPATEAARLAAVRRWTEAGGWVWSRRRSHAPDISALTALTLAVWAARETRPAARPRLYVAG